MTLSQVDFTQDAPGLSPGSPEAVARVTELTARYRALELTLVERETELKELKAEFERITTVELPEALDLAGLSALETNDGARLELKSIVAGSIPKRTLPEALAWLRAHGYGALIKRELVASFGRGEDERAEAVATALRAQGIEFASKETVHPQTLGSWARELLSEGKSLPLDLLGLFVGRRATLIAPKE